MSDAAARNTSRRRDRLFSGVPYPSRACGRGIFMPFCRHPPHPRLRRDTRALLPAPPPRPRLRRDIHTLLRHPPPHPRLRRDPHALLPAPPTPPAPSALLPRPLLGAGSVRGDTWWEAVPGFSPGSPRALDRGDIATGGGADGEGELVPPPLSLTLPRPHISPLPHPAWPRIRRSPAAPTPPAPAALLPRPRRGPRQ